MSLLVTCNAGSTNVKLAAFDATTLQNVAQTTAACTQDALRAWLATLPSTPILGFAHRVVHGGQEFTQPTPITAAVIEKLAALTPLAPLHQPAALLFMQQTVQLYPNTPQVACFDTAFHHTNPQAHRRFALPRALHAQGIMRYGFHGLSYQHIANVLQAHYAPYAAGRVVVAHLGGGASVCALHNGRSIATSMGFSTLDGLMMGTRCGSLDAGVVLYLLTEKNLSPAQVSTMLYQESGLKGVSGLSSNMQELLQSDCPHAQEAVELYCYTAATQIAALLPSIGGLDALVFTGGIGQNATVVRDKITQHLAWLGNFAVLAIAANEELVLATACKNLVLPR